MYTTIHPRIRYRLREDNLYEFQIYKRRWLFSIKRTWFIAAVFRDYELAEFCAKVDLQMVC